MFKNPLRCAADQTTQMAADFGNTSTTTSAASLSRRGENHNFGTRAWRSASRDTGALNEIRDSAGVG